MVNWGGFGASVDEGAEGKTEWGEVYDWAIWGAGVLRPYTAAGFRGLKKSKTQAGCRRYHCGWKLRQDAAGGRSEPRPYWEEALESRWARIFWADLREMTLERASRPAR